MPRAPALSVVISIVCAVTTAKIVASPSVRPVLRCYYDFSWLHRDGLATDENDGLAYARLGLRGNLRKDLSFNVQFDAGDYVERNGNFALRYAALQWTFDRDLILEAGQSEEPYGFEAYGSIKHTLFVDRALPFVFSPYYHLGIGFLKRSHHTSLQLAAFGNTIGPGPDDDGRGLAGRLTHQFLTEPKTLLHAGFSFSLREPNSRIARFRPRPESQVTPFRFLDSGAIAGVDRITAINAELLWVHKRITFLSEFTSCHVARDGGPDLLFTGGHCSVAYFLVGTRRTFDSTRGIFVDAANSFDRGALEIALRQGFVNLNSRDVSGGRELNLTAGINWYFHRYWRVTLNHTWINVRNGTSVDRHELDQLRLEFDL